MKELLDRLGKIDIRAAKDFMEEMLQVLRSPQVEPQKAALVLIVLIAFALLTLALGLLIYSFIRPSKPKEGVKEEAEEEGIVSFEEAGEKPWISKETQILLVVVGSFLVILLATGLVVTARAPFCNTCHSMNREYRSWKTSTHRSVGCLSCHQEPGATGFLIQKTNYLRWSILTFTKRSDSEAQATVENASCNRCHAEVSRKTVSRYGITVRHRDFLTRGDKCVDCHNTVGHADTVLVKRLPSMDNCVVCHNGKTASTECELCHAEDIAVQPRTSLEVFSKVSLGAPKTCRGCHSIEKCTACHGLEMPHPEGWILGGHARLAFTGRFVCWKCHPGRPNSSQPFAFCDKCHKYRSLLHEMAEDNWASLHGPLALKKETGDFSSCWLCHGLNICDRCHTGKREVIPGREATPAPKVDKKDLPPGHPNVPDQ